MSSAQRGQFVWHELITSDTAGASDFYPRIAGWKTQAWDNDNTYTMWVGEEGPLGGIMSLSQDATASHWMPYIGTDDVAATVAAARELGAKVCKDTTQLPNGGSFAVLQDPQGAAFAVHSDGSNTASGASPERRDFSWHELSTGDLDTALDFYTALFGWDAAERHDMGEMGFYQLFARNGVTIGGMYAGPPGMSPHWLSYVRVPSVDDAANAAKAAGGRIVNGPMEVPGGDWIAQIIDPQGAAFAVHEVKSARQPSAKATSARAKPKTAKARSVRKSAAKKSAAKSLKAKRKARRGPAPGKTGAQTKATRGRAWARATGAAKIRRYARRAPAKRSSSARRRPAARKKAARRTARRVVRAKRRR
jgi:predicted enzyme related to lactoylglutathione lyase